MKGLNKVSRDWILLCRRQFEFKLLLTLDAHGRRALVRIAYSLATSNTPKRASIFKLLLESLDVRARRVLVVVGDVADLLGHLAHAVQQTLQLLDLDSRQVIHTISLPRSGWVAFDFRSGILLDRDEEFSCSQYTLGGQGSTQVLQLIY